MNDLLDSFPKANKDQWIKIASKELGDRDPFKALRWAVDADVQANPYYDQSDLLSTDSIASLLPAQREFSGPRAWHNMPVIRTGDLIESNKQALHHLQHGADGVIFNLSRIESYEAFDQLLKDIEWPYCPLGFRVDQPGTDLAELIIRYINSKDLPKESLEGFLIWDTLPAEAASIAKKLDGLVKFRSLIISVKENDILNQLVAPITSVATYLQTVDDRDIEAIVRNIGFSLDVGEKFFSEIAKLKSMRYLWLQVSNAFGARDAGFIHTTSASWTNEVYQPHGNMIKSTTSAMAAICGGCDVLTIEPENPDDPMMRRVARNISSVLREESYLNKVADPTAGSYFVESLVTTFCEKAWEMFQSNMNR